MRWSFRRCPPEGALRRSLDQPADVTLRQHVEICPRCQQRLEELRQNAWLVSQAMAALEHSRELPVPDRIVRKESTMPRLRLAASLVAATVTLALVLAFVPLGALADQLVQRFRVQQFAAITIPADTLRNVSEQLQAIPEERRAAAYKQFMQAFDVSQPVDGEKAREVGSLEAVAQHLGRPPLVPARVPEAFSAVEPRYLVADAGEFQMTVDVARTRAALDQLGLRFASLPDPATTPTVTVRLTVPASAAQVWRAGDEQVLVVAELESPTLELPAEIDPELLREDLLMLPGLPPDVVAQIRAIRDWRQTLIIPVPEGATSRTVSLRGTNGLLIEAPEGAAVLWQERGVLHIVGGSVSAEHALAVARSLR